MATHSSVLAWRIPWTEEPGGLQSMGLQRVGHDWATSLSLFSPFQIKIIKKWVDPFFPDSKLEWKQSVLVPNPHPLSLVQEWAHGSYQLLRVITYLSWEEKLWGKKLPRAMFPAIHKSQCERLKLICRKTQRGWGASRRIVPAALLPLFHKILGLSLVLVFYIVWDLHQLIPHFAQTSSNWVFVICNQKSHD